MVGTSEDATSLIEALERPDRLWTRAEVLERPSPVPPVPGVYGWHFTRSPANPLEADRLLYVGIAPKHSSSTQNLRKRVRYHFRGDSSRSTLRLTLECLIGLELRRVGSGQQMTFGPAGEQDLSDWMAARAGLLVPLVAALAGRSRRHRPGGPTTQP